MSASVPLLVDHFIYMDNTLYSRLLSTAGELLFMEGLQNSHHSSTCRYTAPSAPAPSLLLFVC